MQTTTTTQHVYLTIPSCDLGLIRTLSQKMGWTLRRPRKGGLQKAIEDVRAGRVYEAKNVDDLLAQLDD
ncbi:MAG: hypothetical protein IJ047_03190 [Paludibacteraceae bacterium]|nr:hypothetical protein [Paludibacteraceae bacterium]